MSEREIDIEKDRLVIFRNRQGAFKRYRWFKGSEFTKEVMDERIAEYNGYETDDEDRKGWTAELVTDRLVREICAYNEFVYPFERIAEAAKEAQKSADDAAERLKSALRELRYVMEGLNI